MKFQPTFLRKNRINLPVSTSDRVEYRGEIIENGKVIGVPIFQTPFQGKVDFRLDAIVKSLSFNTIPPSVDNPNISLNTSYAKSLQLRYQRADNANPAGTTPPFWVVNAGVPDYIFNSFGNPLNAVANQSHRLTFQPLVKRIALDQPEFIFFFNNTDPAVAEIVVTANIRFQDNTTLNILLEKTAVPAMSLATINASPIIFEDQLFGRKLAGYDIRVTDEVGQLLLPVHEYDIDTRYHQTETFLIYQNSFGTWDTLRCFGQSSYAASVEKSYYENLTGRRNFNTTGRRNFMLNTGQQEQGIKEALPEILFSESIYLFDGFNSLQVNCLTTTLEAASSDTQDEGIELEFENITADTAFYP